jgi:hypothetical protein
MDRFVSEPLELPVLEEDEVEAFYRADLVFYGVDHSGPSFEAHVFLDQPEADEQTPRDLEHGYAGSFTVFGHDGCYGDVGHCDVRQGPPKDPFDIRPPHPLTPLTKTVIATEAVEQVSEPTFTVTVVPLVPGEERLERADVLVLDNVRLVTYSDYGLVAE